MSIKPMRRREFLKENLAAAIAVGGLAKETAGGQGETMPAYRGPISEFDLADRELDSLSFALSLYGTIKPAMSFTATNQAAARLWQNKARQKLIELLGGFPGRVPLQARVLETERLSGYTREKIIFQSRDNLSVFGYLLIPENVAVPAPAIVCLPGHGRGCDDIVGIDEKGQQRANKSGYSRDFAVQVVEHGYCAFAIEQLAFGCRRDDAARKKGAGQSSCQPAAGAALLFGQTMIGWRVWDVMRAIDYLMMRKEVDRSRIATMGISGGGTVSLFAAALDERIKVGVVSGYFNTFRDSILSLSHCMDNYVPGILNNFEMYDLAGLVAPRSLFVESGERDPIFPIRGSRAAFKKAQEIYSVFGKADCVGQEVFDDEHVFYGKGAFEFLKRVL